MVSPQMFEMIGIAPRSDFDLARITEEGIQPIVYGLNDRG